MAQSLRVLPANLTSRLRFTDVIVSATYQHSNGSGYIAEAGCRVTESTTNYCYSIE